MKELFDLMETPTRKAVRILKGDLAHEAKMRGVAEMIEDEYDNDAEKGFSSGMSTGQGVGGSADQAGSAASGAVSGAQQTAGEVTSTMKAEGCSKCDAGICPHHYAHASKALTTRDLVIPRHPTNDIWRSATQQTSRMYTSLAEPVRDTFRHVLENEGEDPRVRAVKSVEARSEQVQELRNKLSNEALVTRKSLRWTR